MTSSLFISRKTHWIWCFCEFD